MTKSEQFEAKQQSMPDNKLIDLCEKEVRELCKTRGESITMCVPPMVTDTDMVLYELIRRYKEIMND